MLLTFQRGIRDRSLIMGSGGTKWEGGGKSTFTPTKRGTEKVLAMLKGGHKRFCGSFNIGA